MSHECKLCKDKGIVIVEVKVPSTEGQGTYEVQQCAACDALSDDREAAVVLHKAGYTLLVKGEWL